MTLRRMAIAITCAVLPQLAQAEPTQITLDRAIELAVRTNHALAAARTTIDQSRAGEVTAGLRPNPALTVDVQGPLGAPDQGSYLDAAGFDVGLSHLFERGDKRGRRIQAARDVTAATQAQVADAGRTLVFQVASQFIAVQLAESTLELARDNLASFERAVAIAEDRYKTGGMSENDVLKIKLQLLQFQTDLEAAGLARIQALADLRQLLGHDAVAADYDVAGSFEYRPFKAELGELQKRAARSRPDLAAAVRGVTAAKSQHALADANSAQDVTLSGTYARSGGVSTGAIGLSIPLAIFDRNQGEIARTRSAIAQAEQQQAEVAGQVMTDVRDAYEGLEHGDRIVQYYRSGYLDLSKRSREISDYAYRRGATSLFDFLDAERAYRATQIGYRQALAAYLVAIEQVRQSVGSRSVP